MPRTSDSARRAARLAPLLAAALGCGEPPPSVTGPTGRDSVEVAWRTPVAAPPSGLHGLATDGTRLFALVEGVTAYDMATGAQLWRSRRAEVSPSDVATRDGRVFVSSSAAIAYDARTGAELWRFAPDTLARAESAVDDRAFYIGTESRRVYALDVATGRPLWSAESIPRGQFPARVTGIVAHGDTLYASTVEEMSVSGGMKRGWITALDRGTGAVLWRFANERAGEAHDLGRHAVAGRILLANDLNGGAILGIDRFTGKEVWRYVGPRDRLGAWDAFKVVDGTAYVASNDANVYALQPETGQLVWKTGLRGSASSSAVCGVHVFATMGSLHMLRRSDGREMATLFLDRDGFVRASQFVVSRLLAHGERVYFVGHDGVYAVRCG